ncbi:MAG: hypothetical protein IKI52_04105 [Clostridia bacterium]|nr:hypothetical protein [Clostridia bacterium]
MSERNRPKDKPTDDRPAGRNEPARPVFIDLDDAYGVPFSSAPVSVQPYGTDREQRAKPRRAQNR